MRLIIPRYCSNCGKWFEYVVDEKEFRQRHDSIEYLCEECENTTDNSTDLCRELRDGESVRERED